MPKVFVLVSILFFCASWAGAAPEGEEQAVTPSALAVAEETEQSPAPANVENMGEATVDLEPLFGPVFEIDPRAQASGCGFPPPPPPPSSCVCGDCCECNRCWNNSGAITKCWNP